MASRQIERNAKAASNKLEWLPEANAAAAPEPNSPLDSAATFFEALRDQLGLKLESAKMPLRVLVIDKVDGLTEN